jgi:hypothetical protein
VNLLTKTDLGGRRYKLTAGICDTERGQIASGDMTVIDVYGMGPCRIDTVRWLPRQPWMEPDEQIYVLEVEALSEPRLTDH